MDYKSRLTEWDRQAAVRTGNVHLLERDELSEKWLYPPELVPYLQHPMLAGIEEASRRRVAAKHLMDHLDFTDCLEHDVINKVTYALAREQLPVCLPTAMRRDAYKIYVDEAFHSLTTSNLRFQLEDCLDIPSPSRRASCLRRIQSIIQRLPAELVDLAWLCFAVVSETLISKVLGKVPKDRRVVQAVRDVLADHARDEAIHHAYFSTLFDLLWPQLDSRTRGMIGPLLPEFIHCFLAPDLETSQSHLLSLGLSPAESQQVLCDTYTVEKTTAEIRADGSATLRLFLRNGLFEDDRVASAFDRFGLQVKCERHS